MINNKPNIFEFATKELSQDAVFMYLLDCYNSNCHEEKKVGQEFVDLILTNHMRRETKPVKVVIKKQYHNIDVLVLLEYNDKSVDAIIIEDKIYTSQHDNQLERYYDDINKNGVDGIRIDNIFGIYFKLGELTPGEKKALHINEIFEYKLLDYKSFLDFLNKYKNTNPLIKLIYEFYEERTRKILQIDNADFSNPEKLNFNEVMSDSYAQYKYMNWIMSEVIPKEFYHPKNQYSVMNYGRPCTQYRFIFTEDDINDNDSTYIANGNISDYSYFFRIDSNSNGWYISINQYVYNGDQDQICKKKREVRDIIRKSIKDIDTKGFTDYADNRGKKESKICLFIIKSFKDVEYLKPVLKEIHEKIVSLAVTNNR